MATIQKRSPSDFLLDRAWRILPLWAVAVTPWLLYKHSTGPELIASLTFWPIYHRFIAPALIVGWSLSFEILFYGAIAVGMRTRPAVPLLAFAIAVCWGMVTRWPLFDLVGNPIIFEFLIGGLIAQLPRRPTFALPSLAAASVLFALSPFAIYSADVAVNAAFSGWRVLFWGVPAGMIVYGCICAEDLFARPVFRPLVVLGDASYSIYLFHLGVIIPLAILWPLKIPLAIGAGLVVWRFVERPMLEHRHYISDIRRLRFARSSQAATSSLENRTSFVSSQAETETFETSNPAGGSTKAPTPSLET